MSAGAPEDPLEGSLRGTSSLRAFAIGCAVLAVSGVLAALGFVPPIVGTVAGLVLLFGGAALAPLARLSPVEPSLLKIATLAVLVSPLLATTVYVLAALVLEARLAVAVTFTVLSLLQLPGIGAHVHRVPLGAAGKLALAFAVGCGALTALFLLQGSAARASYHGLLHSTLVLAVDRGVPPTNPFLAGEPLGYYWFWHAMGALVARASFLAPTVALAALQVWSATVMPLALYFTAAPLLRDGKRELTGVLLAVFGLNAIGGLLWLSRGMPWQAPEQSLQVIGVLSSSVADWDPRLAYGFSKLGNLSSYPVALALLTGGWMAAAHALRGGVPTWVGMSAVLHGGSFAVNPVVGGIGLAGTGLTSLLAGREGLRVLVSHVVASLPGLYLVLVAGSAYAGETVAFGFDASRPWGTLAPVLLLVVAGLGRFVGESGEDEDDGRRGRIAALLLCGAGVPLILHLVVTLPYDNQYKLVRIAALPLGLLAGGGLGALVARGGALRAVGAGLALLLGAGVLANNVLGARTYLAFAQRELPLVEAPLELAPSGGDARGVAVAGAYGWLRERGKAEPGDRALVVNPFAEVPTVFGTAAAPHAFTDPVRNLQGHEAAPFTGVDLFCDRPSQALDARSDGWRERMLLLERLFRTPDALGAADLAAMKAAASEVIVLVTDADRQHADVDGKLLAAGFTRVFPSSGDAAGAALYLGTGERAR